MSYILSALKKAEEERRRGNIPDVLTTQQAVGRSALPLGQRTATRLYLFGGLAVLLLAGAWLAKRFYPGDEVIAVYHGSPLQPGPAGVVRQAGEPPGTIFAPASRGAPVVVKSGEATYSVHLDDRPTAPGWNAPTAPAHDFPVERGAPAEGTDAARTTADPPLRPVYDDRVRDFDELPPSLRRQLPQLVLSGHLYSLKYPQARKVILNGTALKENQYLDDDLMISEITPGGVILDFRGMLFSMNASRMFR